MQLSTGTHVATLLYVNVLFIGFPLVSRLVSILHIYILDTHLAMCKKNCHILMGCLFVNLRLTHKPCLGITMVTVVCVVLDHQGVNFLTIVRVNKEAVTLPK